MNVSGGSTTTATVTGLNDGATYYFQIYAVNDIGDSATEATTVSRAVSASDYSASFDANLRVANSGNVIPAAQNATFSVEAWFKLSAQPTNWNTIVQQGQTAGPATNRFYLGVLQVGDVQKLAVARQAVTVEYFDLPESVGAWRHVAVTVNDDVVNVYIDGARVGQDVSIADAGNSSGFSIGSIGSDYVFAGEIDQVKIWGDVLTPSEVAASMHAWQADTDYDGTDDIDNLIAHYDFNDSTQAANIRDMAGSKDMTVTNGATSDLKSLVNRPSRTGYEVFEFTRSYLTALGGWKVPEGVTSVDYLVVGGGGGGGRGIANAHGGGGGGGGGFLEASSSPISGVQKIVVGQGGLGTGPGTNGGSSQFSTHSVAGGGGGGYYYGAPGAGASGGGAGHTATNDYKTGGTSTASLSTYGSSGGNTTSSGWGQMFAAGGGGAGGSGSNGGPTESSGRGGDGKSSAISGSTRVFGAGGGGGGGENATTRSQVSEGGGAGGYRTAVEFASGLDGLSGRGGGGGGGTGYNLNSQAGDGAGGNGGSGVVIVAYQVAGATATNPSNVSALTTQTATFTTDASASVGTPTYQWQVSSDGGSSFSNIAGAKNASYTTLPLTSADNNKQYRVVVTASLNGSTDTVTTNAATLTVSDIVSSSLILHYNASDINSFDPTVSTTAVKDLSGNNRNATIVTNSGDSVSREDQAFKFDGSESYIDLPDLPSTIDFSAGITIDFVADFETANSWERIIDFGNGPSAENIIVARPGTEPNNIRFEIYDAVDSSNQPIDYISFEFTNALLSGLNRYTIKVSHSEVTLYHYPDGSATAISGTQKAGSGFGVPKNSTRTNNYVGKSNFADAMFDGSIRQISLYNQPLSPSQVGVTYQTVTFDSNGGTDPDSLITSGTIRLPSPGTNTGFTFGGWYTAEDYLTSAGDGDVGDTYTPGDTTLHAKWNPNSYNITWNANGGTLAGDEAATFVTGGTVAEPSNPSRDGFTFVGWSTSNDAGNGVAANQISSWPYSPGVTSAITLYAIWQSNLSIVTPTTGLSGTFGQAFSLSISSSGGSGTKTFSASGLPAGLSINNSTGAITGTPTASGNSSVTVTVADTSSQSASTSAFTISITPATLANSSAPKVSAPKGQLKQIFATWDSVINASSYTLKVYPGAGGDAVATISGITETSKTITNSDFGSIADNTEYKVSVTAVGTGNYVQSAESAQSVAVTTNKTNQLQLIYYAGASFTSYVTGAIAEPPSFNRPGWTLTGWSTTQADSNGVEANRIASWPYDPGVNEAVTLYAIGTPNLNTVTFKSNYVGGPVDSTQSVTTGQATNLTSNAFSRSGYFFSGWSTQADGGGTAYDDSESVTLTGNLELFANWSRNTISFNQNYGDNSITSLDYETGDLVTLPTLTRSGFDLQSWLDASGNNVGAAGASYSPLTSDELILRYEFDDPQSYSGSGITVNDISSTVNTSVSGNKAGTMFGPTYSSANGGYLSFDGVNDYLRTADLRDRDGGTNAAVAGPVSIFVWIYPQSENGVIVTESGQTTLTVESDWHDSQIEMVAGHLEFNTWSYANPNPTTTNKLPLNQWYYVGLSQSSTQLSAFVFDSSGSPVALTNGTVNKSRAVPDSRYQGLTYAIGHKDFTNLGGRDYGGFGNFRLGAFHVYNKALSSAEVSRNYQATCARFHQDSNNCTGQTLSASWTPSNYTITFEAGDNGAGASQTESKTHGTNLTLPSSATANGWFTREGYTLTAWSENSDGSTSDYTLEGAYAANADDTLYPVWTANDNTVTFKANYSGGPADKTQTITTDAATALNQSFSQTGYTFDEWTTNADGTGTSYTLTETVTIKGDLTLYAQWVAASYNLTYNYNGATGGNTAATATYTTGTAPITLAVPIRTGYTFAGWYLDSGFGGSALGDTLTLTADDDVYARWTANTYTVIYNYNGATGGNTAEDDTYTTGDAATEITLPTPTRTGYNFGGWYEAADFSGSAESSPYTTSLNRTLYAKWNAIDFAFSYDANGASSGSVPSASVNYNYQDSVPVLGRGSLIRTGHTFLGWTTDAGGTGTLYQSGDIITMPAVAVTLYAKWQKNSYTISYNLNGGSGSLVGAPTIWTTGDANVNLPTNFTRTGFDFDGWQKLGTTTKVNNSYMPNYESVALVARWTLKDINVTYAKGSASGTNVTDPMLAGLSFPSNLSNKFGSTITLSNALAGAEIDAVDGAGVDHEFFGWSDGSTTYQPNDTYVLTETAPTFTAQWARIYQVNYAYNGGSPTAGEGQFDDQCQGGNNTCSNGDVIQLNSAPNRDGYIFTGWKDQSGASYTAGGNMTVDGDSFLLYAQWDAIEYQFTFNSLQGSLNPVSQELNIGQVLTFPSPGSKTGYTFGGWSADGGATKFDKGATVVVGTSGAAYSAVWFPNVYQISYDLNGGTGTPISGSFLSYEVGTGNMSLPPEGDLDRDGYTFGGWSENRGGTAVEDYQPTQDGVLYAVWNNGNFTLSYNPKGGTGGGAETVARTQSVTLPTPVRNGFVFTGWYDAETGGNKIGNGGATHTPSRSKTLYARWVQRSLFGVDSATLENASSRLTATARGGANQVGSITSGSISARVTVPAGALPAGTVVEAKYFKDTVRQSALIPGDNQYFFSVLVSWLNGSGENATVPDTDPELPVSVKIDSDAIKAGARIYQVIGDQVTDLGVATENGTVTVQLYEDPEIVVAATKPGAPTGVSGTAGNTQSSVSWTAPASNGGSEITSYTVTASPGGAACSTATTSCTVTGLTNGTAYTFTVTATNSVGTSDASSRSAAVTPALATYAVTFNSNGGTSIGNSSFPDGGSLAAPASPTRSGYNFAGWSTVLDDASTKVTFPYSPGVSGAITLYALWTQVTASSGSSSTPIVTPSPTPTPGDVAPPSQIGFTPTPPTTPVSQTGPVGEVGGSSQQVTIVADAPKENLVATGAGWEIKVRTQEPAGNTVQVQEDLGLSSPIAGRTALSATGLRPNTYVEVWAFSEKTYVGTVQVSSTGELDSSLQLPNTLLPGDHTLQIATLNSLGQLITLSIPLTVAGKVTVGTFKGYIAIYTQDLDGQRLSAKVAGKWVVQDPISRFKRYTYSRLVRYTGAGYDILVDVYINRKFYERTTTRTR